MKRFGNPKSERQENDRDSDNNPKFFPTFPTVTLTSYVNSNPNNYKLSFAEFVPEPEKRIPFPVLGTDPNNNKNHNFANENIHNPWMLDFCVSTNTREEIKAASASSQSVQALYSQEQVPFHDELPLNIAIYDDLNIDELKEVVAHLNARIEKLNSNGHLNSNTSSSSTTVSYERFVIHNNKKQSEKLSYLVNLPIYDKLDAGQLQKVANRLEEKIKEKEYKNKYIFE
jgi:hypothetical protein